MPILILLILASAFLIWLSLAFLYRPLGHAICVLKGLCDKFGDFVEGKESEEKHGK